MTKTYTPNELKIALLKQATTRHNKMDTRFHTLDTLIESQALKYIKQLEAEIATAHRGPNV